MVRRLSSLLLALSILGVAACDRPAGDGSFSAGPLTGPRAGLVADTATILPDYSRVVLLRGEPSTAEQSVTKIVYNTGKLVIGAHSLNIWDGTLDEPLVFTLTIRQRPYLAAELKAVKLSDGTPVTTFKAPLHLKLSYAKTTTQIPDVNRLGVYYVLDGVVKEETASWLNAKGQTVYADIWHFSEYSPGLDGMQ